MKEIRFNLPDLYACQGTQMGAKMNHIILIGFMGCGKSTIGIRLSYRLKRTLEDTDRRIEREQGMSVSEIFALQGEESFRKMETQLLRKMETEPDSRIIATGGGLPLREENRTLLGRLGRVVYLRVRPETVYERLKNDTTRPLLQGEDPRGRIRALMEERAAAYETAADLIVDVDGMDPEEITQKIAAAMTDK